MRATTSNLEDVYAIRETDFEWSEKMLAMTSIRQTCNNDNNQISVTLRLLGIL